MGKCSPEAHKRAAEKYYSKPENREKRKAYRRAWYAANRDREKQKKYDGDWILRMLRIYGLTLDQYHAKVESQNFCCAICGEVPLPQSKSHDGFHNDHNHATGQNRGLLCVSCNRGIGFLKDSAEKCRAAATYLDSFALVS